MSNLIDRYRKLDKDGDIPDVLWECDKLRSIISYYECRITIHQIELASEAELLLINLKKKFTIEQIKAAGLYPCLADQNDNDHPASHKNLTDIV